MQKAHIITIGGVPGSGKSTTAKRVAERLGYARFSSGDCLREAAKERGVSIEELNTIAESDPSIDRTVDQKLQELADANDIVVDSRLAFHWIPSSFKVYLALSEEEAAQRVFSDKNTDRLSTSAETDSLSQAQSHLHARLESEKKRYQNLYNINPYDPRHFDLVIDTGIHDIDTVVDMIIDAYTQWSKEDS